ncbi:MAG: hypothetical protein ACO1Q7_17805 [Gemmatimonas sp.]
MNLQLIALLSGLFVVPLALLSISHKLRRRSPRLQAAFWGALWAHILAAVAAIIASMIAAEEWQSTDTWRGFFGFWAMLAAPLIGGVIGYLRTGATTSRS